MSTESQEQRESAILQQLVHTRDHIEQDIATTPDTLMKRIEADAALVVTLSLVNDLLPIPIQQQVRAILALHEQVWEVDTPPRDGNTPRKPLGSSWFSRLPFFPRPSSSTESLGDHAIKRP